ncbi:MAG: DNA methyltransferase [Candidatus Electryoneaceae bacterium]|nr:DNA methyltransferase [Candidatus Electryoneaceae bacterium]
MTIPSNCLYFGDNLEFLRNSEYFPSESVDLIYLDPPFNSSQSYNILYKEVEGTPSTAQVKAFEDTWYWDESAAKALYELNMVIDHTPQPLVSMLNMLEQFLGHSPMYAYLVQMSARIVELHRILKPTGSLFLHCDPTASHYLKLVLDAVFGPKMFKNEIVWHYRRWTAKSYRLQRMHDIILFYGRDEAFFNIVYEPYGDWIKKDYKHVDEDGRRWRWHSPHGVRQKVYLDDPDKGVPLNDVWQIPFIGSTAKERLGYPTQKPLRLLKQILEICSDPGHVILDPFCGCGTTIDATEQLNQENPDQPPRRWIGIDITHLAIDLIKYRLSDRFGLTPKDYEVMGEPTTLPEAYALAYEDRYQFQYWALGLIGARPWGYKKKGADRGIDGFRSFLHGSGRTYSKCIIQVKSGKVGPSMIRDLKGTMEREKAPMSVFVTLEPTTSEMRAEATSAGFYHSEVMNRDYPRMQLLTIEQLLQNPDSFTVPPGGDYRTAAKYRAKPNPQGDVFEDK